MKKRIATLFYCVFLIGANTCFAEPDISLQDSGDALRSIDISEMLKLAERYEDNLTLPEMSRGLRVAALVHAFSGANEEAIKECQALIPPATLDKLGDLNDFTVMQPRSLPMFYRQIPSTLPMQLGELRRAIILALSIGNRERIAIAKKRIVEAGFEPRLRDAMLDFANDALRLCERLPASPLKAAVDVSIAAEQEDSAATDAALATFAEYLDADPLRRELMARSRSDKKVESNQYDQMVAMEQSRAAVIEAVSKVRENYWRGEIARGQAMEQMQKVIGNSMDLKKKRALLYWALKSLREKETRAERENAYDRNKARTEKLRERRSEDISPSWPGIFDHPALKIDATELQETISNYSERNCGLLSICFTRSSVCMRRLHRTLANPIDGLTMSQQGMLRAYLRELEQELQEPYSKKCNLYYLANSLPRKSPPGVTANQTDQRSDVQNAVQVALPLTNDTSELASFALYQSMLASLAAAGQESDRGELKVLAKLINESSLLTSEHKAALKNIGSQIYRGDISEDQLREVDDPISVLSQIAGVVSGDSQVASALSESAQEEAFAVLMAQELGPAG